MKTYLMAVILLTILTLSISSATSKKPGGFISEANAEEYLSAIVPKEYSNFANLQAKGYNLDTCKAVVVLANKVCKMGQDYRAGKIKNSPNKSLGGAAQLMAWFLVVRTYKTTTDPKGKALILKTWNDTLRNTPEEAREQMMALDFNWDKTLLTKESLEVFKNTKVQIIIHQFCMVFGNHGGDREKNLLKAKLAFVDSYPKDNPIHKWNHDNIQSALNNITMRKSESMHSIHP
jgi:hypothetical protein